MREYWIVTYAHRHGTDAWAEFDEEPTEESVIQGLDEWEPDREEFIEIRGPFTVPDSSSGTDSR